MNSSPVTLENPNVYFKALDAVESLHWWARGVERIERRWIERHFGINRAGTGDRNYQWLDIGCGTGGRLRRWADWNCWALQAGAEPESAALTKVPVCESPMQFIQSAWPGLPFQGPAFDLVTAFDVLQHVAPALRSKAVREAAGLVKPGGAILIRTNSACFQSRRKNDQSIVDQNELKTQLTEAGLSLQRESCFNFTGGLFDELKKSLFHRSEKMKKDGTLKTGLPAQWRNRPAGHWLAGFVGGLESYCAAFGLAKIPLGHSYLVMATRDGAREQNAGQRGQHTSENRV